MRKAFSETDLAGPLYRHLERQGYTVRSEVKDCDIAALKGEDLLIIEIKKTLNLPLVVQAVRRQRMTDSVYIAIPRPSNKWKWWKESRGVQHLLRRLELGLLLVSLDKGRPAVEVVFHPLPFARRKRAASRRAVLEEISRRTADYNRAGSSRTKLATAYREDAIHVACCLLAGGKRSPAGLRALGTGKNTMNILRWNPYGWFERVERGIYGLTGQGEKDLSSWPELRKKYMAAARRALRRVNGSGRAAGKVAVRAPASASARAPASAAPPAASPEGPHASSLLAAASARRRAAASPSRSPASSLA